MATIEDYICELLEGPLRLKDGSYVLNDEGKPITKEEGIAMNLVNQALQGDIKSIEHCSRAKVVVAQKKKKQKRKSPARKAELLK